MLKSIIAIGSCILSLNAFSEAYLCTADSAAGLINDKTNKWKGWHINKPDYQLIFKPLSEADKQEHEAEYGFYTVKNGRLVIHCNDWRPEHGVAFCSDHLNNYRFTRKTFDYEGNIQNKARFIAYSLNPDFRTEKPLLITGGCIKID